MALAELVRELDLSATFSLSLAFSQNSMGRTRLCLYAVFWLIVCYISISYFALSEKYGNAYVLCSSWRQDKTITGSIASG